MGEESLVGITDLVSGEKDPRNLMLIFSTLRVIMIEWDITKYAETMFDSVYAYFPITFRPPPNDPYGITAQDLKDRLRDCISSSSILAPYFLPNLLDKLDSTSPVVKVSDQKAWFSIANNSHRKMYSKLFSLARSHGIYILCLSTLLHCGIL
jgi:DNA repair/transcription protein MET18/MMS19